MESQMPPVADAEEAERIMAQKGINVVEMTRGEVILEACSMGLINVVRQLETPQYRLNHVNGFGEGCLHYAAKAN